MLHTGVQVPGHLKPCLADGRKQPEQEEGSLHTLTHMRAKTLCRPQTHTHTHTHTHSHSLTHNLYPHTVQHTGARTHTDTDTLAEERGRRTERRWIGGVMHTIHGLCRFCIGCRRPQVYGCAPV